MRDFRGAEGPNGRCQPVAARYRGRVALAICAAVGLLGVGCTGPADDGAVDVVTEFDAEGLALDNGFASAQTGFDVLGSGATIEVAYFEALRKGTWTAPDHCWFRTRVSVNELESPGFNGPSSDDDTESGEGTLVGTTSRVYLLPANSEPATPVAPSQAPTTVVGQVPDPYTVDPAYPDGDAGPETPIWYDEATFEALQSETSVDGEATVTGRRVEVALVVAFGHDQIIEATSDAPGLLEEYSTSAQPLDGWNVLEVAFDADAAPAEVIPIKLRRLHADGTESTEDLAVERGTGELTLMTPKWAFDLAAVDDSCKVPSGDTENVPVEVDRDLLGAEIGDTPLLPEPGEQPADPASAADQALASIRKVYDLADVYSADKGDFVENPDDWLRMREELIANDVVAPYMSNLDPVFRSIVFTTPETGVVLYRVGPTYQWEAGRVLLIDGSWRVAAGTVCRDLAAAGYTCRDAVPDPRPGPLG